MKWSVFILHPSSFILPEMRHPQVLIYEGDGRLKAMLEQTAIKRRWALRQPREIEECLELLRHGGPSVLVLKVGRHLEHECSLLERVTALFPQTATVVVGESNHAPLAGIAWDLGADYVVFLPQPRDWLADIVVGLLGGEQERDTSS